MAKLPIAPRGAVILAAVLSGSAGGAQAATPPRDPRVAVQEEFDAAKAAGTVAAWDLFLARHPNSALAEAARRERERLRRQRR